MPIVRRQQKGFEIDVIAILKMLWKRKWLILLSGLVASLLTFLSVLIFVTPEYVTSTTMYANNTNSSDVSTSISSSELNASARLVDTYAAIILSDPVLDQVIKDNNLPMSASKLARCISISSVNDTEVFKVTVRYPSAKMAAQIANSIANIAPEKIAQIVDGCSIKLVSYAKVPGKSAYPSYKSYAQRGFWIGLVLCAVAVLLVATVDTRVKGESELSEWEYPVLGVVPSFEEAEKRNAYGYGNREKGKNELIQ